MTKSMLYCDRCGESIDKGTVLPKLRLAMSTCDQQLHITDSSKGDLDLCEVCADSFNKWWKDV